MSVPLVRLKRCDYATTVHQMNWYDEHHSSISPANVTICSDGFRYDYVEGECPVRPDRVPELIRFCEKSLWYTDSPGPLDRSAYLRYLATVAAKLDEREHQFMGRYYRLREFFVKIHDVQLTPVASVHGDLTLENVVYTGQNMLLNIPPRFVFIDPGYDRGLPCRELDEAKIMQSLDEMTNTSVWVAPHTGTVQSYEWLQEKLKSPAHRLLLASHYLRLLRHAAKHPAWRVEHARKRLEELTHG